MNSGDLNFDNLATEFGQIPDEPPEYSSEQSSQLNDVAVDARLASRLPKMMSFAHEELRRTAQGLMLSGKEQQALFAGYEAAVKEAAQDPYIEQLVKSLPEYIDPRDKVTHLEVCLTATEILEHLLRSKQQALAGMTEKYLADQAKFQQDNETLQLEQTKLRNEEKALAELVRTTNGKLSEEQIADITGQMKAQAETQRQLQRKKNELEGLKQQLAARNEQ